jgi:hypothetical protein
MLKHALIFLITFVSGAAIALTVRTRLHEPHAETHAPAQTAVVVSKTAVAHDVHAHAHAVAPAPPPAAAPAPAAPTTAAAEHAKVVNTICAICGMDVDPSIKPATYRGQLVGFGCGACPPRFEKDPERYGPAALENRVAR